MVCTLDYTFVKSKRVPYSFPPGRGSFVILFIIAIRAFIITTAYTTLMYWQGSRLAKSVSILVT